KRPGGPRLSACKATTGLGGQKKAGPSKAHGEPLGAEELAGAKQALGLAGTPFEVPQEAVAAWRAAGTRGRAMRADWQQRLAGKPATVRSEFTRPPAGPRPAGIHH